MHLAACLLFPHTGKGTQMNSSLSSAALAAGDYNLSIESRADGLVSASKN